MIEVLIRDNASASDYLEHMKIGIPEHFIKCLYDAQTARHKTNRLTN